jgi:hypothetical protein
MPAILLLAVYLFATPGAFAGPRIGGGGGGGAIVCPAQNGRITAELVDLVESAFYDKTRPDAALALLPWREQVKIAVNRVAFADPEFSALLVKRVRYVLEHLEDSLKETRGTELIFPAPQDLSHGRLPPMRFGCQLVGAAIFNDANVDIAKLTISDFIWNAFSEQNKAALILHESIYLTHRDMFRNLERAEMPDSSDTRAMVGYLLSSELDLSHTQAARQRWATGFSYRSPELSGRPQRFLQALLPYFHRAKERTLFLSEKSCHAGHFTVTIEGGLPKGCELRSVVNQWPAKFEVKKIPLHSFDETSKVAEFHYAMSAEKMLEELRLVCPAGGLDRFNPGFRLSCGDEELARVKASERNATTGIAVRNKADFDEFLKDFE